ncbi:transcription factor FER-like iron deficiency-induced transcription factor-like protein [Tanacetum coccineum]
MDSFEYSIGHSNDANFNILQPDFIPETNFENLLSAIQCEINPTDIFCLDSECNHVTNACTPLPLSPQLYDHNEAIDGIDVDIDIDNGRASGTGNDNGTDGIGCYDEMDPNLYLIWDEDEDDVKVSGVGDSSETVTTRNPNTKRRSGGGVKGDRTKSLISERKRRSGMKENLYALRTLVPNISKMDKASIVGDAVRHIQDLQTQARNLRSEIAKIEEANNQKMPSQNSNKTHVSKSPPILKKISKMDMFKVEEKGYYVKLVCNKGQGVAAALHKGLESIKSYEVQSSNLATDGDTFVLTFTFKVLITARELDINLPNLKLWISGVFLNQGFKFSHRLKLMQGR